MVECGKGVIMKICICSSLIFADEVLEISKMLEASGHEVLLPNGIINRLAEQPNFDAVQAKIDTDSHRLHAEKIRECDMVLMCNFLKNCTPGYIGANCFAELYLAQYFEKPIFALFPLPNIPYINDEIRSLDITVLNNDLALLPNGGSSFIGASSLPPVEPQGDLSGSSDVAKGTNSAPTSNSGTSDSSTSDSVGSSSTVSDSANPNSMVSSSTSSNSVSSESASSTPVSSDSVVAGPPAVDSVFQSAPIPADPSALPPNPTAAVANSQSEPITSESVHRDVPAGSHNPLRQLRDGWFSLWNKQ